MCQKLNAELSAHVCQANDADSCITKPSTALTCPDQFGALTAIACHMMYHTHHESLQDGISK